MDPQDQLFHVTRSFDGQATLGMIHSEFYPHEVETFYQGKINGVTYNVKTIAYEDQSNPCEFILSKSSPQGEKFIVKGDVRHLSDYADMIRRLDWASK
jgi:hypothetical protein